MYDCNMYRKFKNPTISYIFNKALVFLLIVASAAATKKNIEGAESVAILNILGLIINKLVKVSCLLILCLTMKVC